MMNLLRITADEATLAVIAEACFRAGLPTRLGAADFEWVRRPGPRSQNRWEWTGEGTRKPRYQATKPGEGRKKAAPKPAPAPKAPKAPKAAPDIDGAVRALKAIDPFSMTDQEFDGLRSMLNGLTVPAIQEVKKRLGYKASGTKPVLVQKIVERAREAASQQLAPPNPPAPESLPRAESHLISDASMPTIAPALQPYRDQMVARTRRDIDPYLSSVGEQVAPHTATSQVLGDLMKGMVDPVGWMALADAVKEEKGQTGLSPDQEGQLIDTARWMAHLTGGSQDFWSGAFRQGDDQNRQPKPLARLRREFEQGADDLEHARRSHPADRLGALRGVLKDVHDTIVYRDASNPDEAENHYPGLFDVYRQAKRLVPDLHPEEFANVVLGWRDQGKHARDGIVELRAMRRDDYGGNNLTPAQLGRAIADHERQRRAIADHERQPWGDLNAQGRLVIRRPRP